MDKIYHSFKRIPGGITGIISILIMSIFGILSYINYPSHEFKLFSYVVSELGVGGGAIFFNIGLILSGIFLIPFFLKLNITFSEVLSPNTRTITLLLGLISSSSYLLLGFFPLNLILHMIMVFNIFFIGLCNIIILVVTIIRQKKNLFCIILLGVSIGYILSIFFYFYTLIFYYSIHSRFEWVMVFLFEFWILAHSLYLLYLDINIIK